MSKQRRTGAQIVDKETEAGALEEIILSSI